MTNPLFDTDYEVPTTNLQRHLWWSVSKHFDSLLEISRMHRSVYKDQIQEAFKTSPEYHWCLFRDFCTVGIYLPQRSSLMGWVAKRLTEKDVFIGSFAEECRIPNSFQHVDDAIEKVPSDMIPRFVVLQNVKHLNPDLLRKAYTQFGKDPIKQTFILIN